MTITAPLRAFATVTGTTARFTSSDGHTEHVTPNPGDDIRRAVVRRAVQEAERTRTSVELVTSGDRGEHRLIILPDGTLTPAPPLPTPEPIDASLDLELHTARVHRTPATTAASSSAAPALITAPSTPSPTSSPSTSPTASPSGEERVSFIAPRTPDAASANGLRGVLARAGFGGPSAEQNAQAVREETVSRHWAGYRTIAVVNGKGGVGKTITTAMLAAVYGRYGGGNVLAWDNNDTRGTLGWRTDPGLYDTTIRDLLPATSQLLSPVAPVSAISRYVHHQAADRYDVLRSNPELLATDQRLTPAQFDQLMRVAARYFRLVIFDSGNDESADRWLRMIDSSYALVIPTLTAPESAESASLLLDALRHRDPRSATLAAQATVVVTQHEAAARTDLARIADGFRGQVREVVTIPYDPALKAGPLRFDMLRPATRTAWVTAAAAAVHHF